MPPTPKRQTYSRTCIAQLFSYFTSQPPHQLSPKTQRYILPPAYAFRPFLVIPIMIHSRIGILCLALDGEDVTGFCPGYWWWWREWGVDSLWSVGGDCCEMWMAAEYFSDCEDR